MHRLLELFSGTGSIGKAFLREGWEVISVDIDKKANPTHLANVLTWDYRQYPPGYFDFVWASPPCTQYSIARTCAQTPRDLEGSDRIVERTQEIISYFDCLWAMENPFTGLLKSRPCMAGMDRYLKVVSYCKYGMPYRKNTAIWSNLGEYGFQSHFATSFRCANSGPTVRHATRALHNRDRGRVETHGTALANCTSSLRAYATKSRKQCAKRCEQNQGLRNPTFEQHSFLYFQNFQKTVCRAARGN